MFLAPAHGLRARVGLQLVVLQTRLSPPGLCIGTLCAWNSLIIPLHPPGHGESAVAAAAHCRRVTAAAWGGMLVFDVMIFILTLYKALQYETCTGSLFSILFRDGCMYFGIMITVNAINIGIYTMVLHLIQRKPTLIN
ncbi:hypothetical protein C8J57DRAFT_1477388 [Mycena rebaudengoi]|nr:hypothetical protein C8J57DRAFT_1477388 [Mycena rebaudengoi]